jgi:hypothetical protein
VVNTIHTFTVSLKLIRKSYYSIYEVLRINEKNEGVPITSKYYALGFTEVQLIRVQGKYNYYGIRIRVNPSVLISKQNRKGVITSEDNDAVENAFNQLITTIFHNKIALPHFKEWNFKRLDYAVDIKTEYVKEYIKLSFNNSFDREGSYYKKSNSVGINFYNKLDEVAKLVEKGHATEGDLKKAENVLRIEVQCELSKINGIKNKYDLKGRNVMYFMNPTISKESILYYYDKVVGSGDYYKAYHAYKNIMENNSLSKRSKDNCIDTVKLVAQARSVWKAREQYDAGITIKNSQPSLDLKGSKAAFNEHLKIIRKIGVNPVTIPKEWKINYLPNIRTQIEQQLL